MRNVIYTLYTYTINNILLIQIYITQNQVVKYCLNNKYISTELNSDNNGSTDKGKRNEVSSCCVHSFQGCQLFPPDPASSSDALSWDKPTLPNTMEREILFPSASTILFQ